MTGLPRYRVSFGDALRTPGKVSLNLLTWTLPIQAWWVIAKFPQMVVWEYINLSSSLLCAWVWKAYHRSQQVTHRVYQTCFNSQETSRQHYTQHLTAYTTQPSIHTELSSTFRHIHNTSKCLPIAHHNCLLAQAHHHLVHSHLSQSKATRRYFYNHHHIFTAGINNLSNGYSHRGISLPTHVNFSPLQDYGIAAHVKVNYDTTWLDRVLHKVIHCCTLRCLNLGSPSATATGSMFVYARRRFSVSVLSSPMHLCYSSHQLERQHPPSNIAINDWAAEVRPSSATIRHL